MADKLRVSFPIAVDFVDGELPTAAKLTGAARQAKQGLSLVEHALGDVWNQAGDLMIRNAGLTTFANMIPNISRYLGPIKLTNPMIPTLANITAYTYSFVLDTASTHETTLTFPPASGLVGSNYTWAGTSPPTNTQLKTTKGAVTVTGDWYVNTDTGYIYTYDPIFTNWTLAYKPLVQGDLGAAADWNMIPDPNTESSYNFGSCKISYTNNTDNTQGYIIHMPPRGPLRSLRFLQRSPQSSFDASSNSANESTSPSTEALFFQDDSVAADTSSNATHYRYNLPGIVVDQWEQDQQISTGLVYLWDHSQTGTIIQGVLLKAENAATPRQWVLVASGSAIDNWVSNYLTAAGYPSDALTQRDNHASTYYPSGGLKVITVGTSVSDYLDLVQKRLMDHDHSSSTSMPTRPVQHGETEGLFTPIEATIPQLDPSTLSNDDHPQYLHRGGTTAGGRDKYWNSILGPLLMASTGSATNYRNTSANSMAMYFGDVVGPGILFDYSLSSPNPTGGLCSIIQKPLRSVVSISGGNASGEVQSSVFRPTPWNDSFYGYDDSTASDGYGPVRILVLSPEDFLAWLDDGSPSSADYYSSPLLERREHIVTYNVVSSVPRNISMRLESGGAVGSYLWAHINLPFKKYCIVDVGLSVAPAGSEFSTAGMIFAAIGASKLPNSGNPSGETPDEIDLNTVWSSIPAANWGISARIFYASSAFGGGTNQISQTTPLIEVDHSDTATTWHLPYFVLRTPGPAAMDFFVAPVLIFYRVKEF